MITDRSDGGGGFVLVAVILISSVFQNVPGVMAAVAQLLRLPVPLDYQLQRAGPERSNLALLAGVRVPMMQVTTHTSRAKSIPS